MWRHVGGKASAQRTITRDTLPNNNYIWSFLLWCTLATHYGINTLNKFKCINEYPHVIISDYNLNLSYQSTIGNVYELHLKYLVCTLEHNEPTNS